MSGPVPVINAFGNNLNVVVGDQTTPAVQIRMADYNSTTTALTSGVSIDDLTCVVDNPAIYNIGSTFYVISALGRFYSAVVLGIAGSTLTLDTPFDFAFSAGDECLSGSVDMNVNGSVTPVTFKVRGDVGTTNVPIDLDITRIIGYMLTDAVPDLGKFGDIVGGIANGMVLRTTNGVVNNIHNIKTNGELTSLCYDFDTFLSTNPAQGTNGLTWRMTFAGQSKHGVAIRLGVDESLDYIIQDDLSSILEFHVIAEGHVVGIDEDRAPER